MDISFDLLLFLNYLSHHLVYPVYHVLWVIAQTSLHTGVVE